MTKKKHLFFFDCEGTKNMDLSSFGFVRTDNYFEITDKEEIRFFDGIKIGQSMFPTKHEHLKSLLICDETTNFGFAVNNDLLFLKRACERYECEKLGVASYDVQNIFRKYAGNGEGNIALAKVINKMQIDRGRLRHHKSADDAEMTMLILQKICHNLSAEPGEIIRCLGASRYDSFDSVTMM